MNEKEIKLIKLAVYVAVFIASWFYAGLSWQASGLLNEMNTDGYIAVFVTCFMCMMIQLVVDSFEDWRKKA
ncbi:hypothetical protein [Paenibacillus alvei]|uniref:hypothetical protein n=1 Tax=Paenibacillus alvei TaxID=44250 RepID=UPI00227E6F42|nr:hypothetical protein [Paenibacillus alvei]MCY7487902.1 hypothetical protein [Paenibacillus alvei]